MAPVSEAKKKANNKWVKNNYKRINLALSFDDYEKVDKYCNDNNISKNKFITNLIHDKLDN